MTQHLSRRRAFFKKKVQIVIAVMRGLKLHRNINGCPAIIFASCYTETIRVRLLLNEKWGCWKYNEEREVNFFFIKSLKKKLKIK